jgi:hypothetical protein
VGTTTIDEALAGMDAVIERARAEGDRIGYFAVLYRKVTAKVKEGIEAGFFDDAERMVRLDCLFADRYLEAVATRDRGGAPTRSWALTFAAGPRWRPLILQHLLVGINAHINLDLGIAAARCSPGDELAGLRRDYDRINAILATMIATIQADLLEISPWMRLLDRVGARTQSEVVRFSIVTARAGAWRFATDLAGSPPAEWDAAIATRDRAVAAVGERVLHPGPWMSAGLLAVRLRERGDVADHLDLLLGASEPSLAMAAARVDTPSFELDDTRAPVPRRRRGGAPEADGGLDA